MPEHVCPQENVRLPPHLTGLIRHKLWGDCLHRTDVLTERSESRTSTPGTAGTQRVARIPYHLNLLQRPL
eukprot:10388854-Alexandrium_andersonii.AAC.1